MQCLTENKLTLVLFKDKDVKENKCSKICETVYRMRHLENNAFCV